ncbi:hypothetical protein RRF57_001045 [Xylaria bambusicola]|uniref:Uncharacterized protein n=1 Tax=Xylaria bambusicola TaxID=326684 RepID=A0AAN7UAX1_9PEZI
MASVAKVSSVKCTVFVPNSHQRDPQSNLHFLCQLPTQVDTYGKSPSHDTPLNEALSPESGRPRSPNSDEGSKRASESSDNDSSADSSICQLGDCEGQADVCEAIGSDLWNGADDYGDDSELSKKARKFFTTINWQAFASIATSHRGGIHCPAFLNHFMGIHGQESNGQYRLINRDFGVHNIPVDGDFNIVGIIDFDGVFAAPPEAAAQYPRLSCMGVEPPGIVETDPYILKIIEQTKPQLAKYK